MIDPTACDIPHEALRPAVVRVTMLDTTSLDAVSDQCLGCFMSLIHEWTKSILENGEIADTSWTIEPIQQGDPDGL